MHKGLKEPHVLLAASNPEKLVRNLSHILTAGELKKIRDDVEKNIRDLFRLGESHLTFAVSLPTSEWRQRTSRLYYGAYNVRRAVALRFDGSFSTDSSDHKNVDQLPHALKDAATYKAKLRDLREDRNLADYSHHAQVGDLLIRIEDAEALVKAFVSDCRTYLISSGITL